MKKIILFLVLLAILIGLVIVRQDDLKAVINTYMIKYKRNIEIGEVNDYYRNIDFNYVQITDNFFPENEKDISNILYTILNAGKNEFTFYCPDEYEDCLSDVQKLANNQNKLSDINNFVHPYNTFSNIAFEYDSLGRVTVMITKMYSDEEITEINEKIDSLLPTLTSSLKSDEENIRSIHDYIINNTKYDSLRSDQGKEIYKSNMAYGPLFEGYAICGGYTDLMELFLERLKIKSFKISSPSHVWNALYLNGKWTHLDLTWDDPVADDGKDYLLDSFFLISTNELLESEKTQHNFDLNVYSEVKED